MKKIVLIIAAILVSTTGFSQKIKLMSGNLSGLKGEDVFEVRFTYENMKVGKISEEAYIEQKRKEADAKDGDGGDRWYNQWLKDRDTRFEPKFIELFNKYSKKSGLFIDHGRDESNYIMVVNTYFTEPGFNVGVSSGYAYVSLKVSFYKRTDLNNPEAVFDIIKARGSTHFDVASRIAEAYALAGKKFAGALPKYLK